MFYIHLAKMIVKIQIIEAGEECELHVDDDKIKEVTFLDIYKSISQHVGNERPHLSRLINRQLAQKPYSRWFCTDSLFDYKRAFPNSFTLSADYKNQLYIQTLLLNDS